MDLSGRDTQKNDPDMHGLLKNMKQGKAAGFTEDEHGTLWNGNRVCVPDNRELKQLILQEAHESPYSIHPGSTKMYLDLKEKYWWVSMKREIAEFVALCDVCQRVKAEHQRPAGLLQPLQVPEWKWDEIGMDFITGLPKTQGGYDSIWVVVDRLTKVARFIPVKTTYGGNKLAELYFARIVSLHGVPKKIVSDRGSQFTSHFWKKLQEELGTRLNFSTAYHPQTDGQTERLNQILEDMLRACVLDFGKTWDKSLPYAEFSYNNSYQASIQMAPYEALYGRKCRTPLLWDQVGESQVFGTDILREAEAKSGYKQKYTDGDGRSRGSMDISRTNEGYTSYGPVVEMSWHRAGVLLLGAQSCLPVPEVPAVGGIGSGFKQATPKDEYPMPVANQLVDAASGYKILSFMDGNAGYYQIFMAEEDINKTAFRCPGAIGLFEWVVMIFGLKSAGATYQRAMNYIYHDLIG
uniref:Putative integrase n=1 Tax=Oryza sativa subsp. japonica TaxID=39947 RepID=Q6UU50_ORYSJ|nr:putative integrase [Oryza sativa Japonica Group]